MQLKLTTRIERGLTKISQKAELRYCRFNSMAAWAGAPRIDATPRLMAPPELAASIDRSMREWAEANQVPGLTWGIVKRGEGLSAPVKRAAVFPSLAAHLLSVGEETGRLDQMFLRIADVFEEETKSAIKRFTSLFEPMIILVMGILIGALVLSMLLAITSINDVAV